MSFDRIVNYLTNENEVYRNRFIEPYDKQVEEGHHSPVKQQRGETLTPGMNRAMKKLSPEQRKELLLNLKAEQENRLKLLEVKLDEMNEKAMTEELSMDSWSMLYIVVSCYFWRCTFCKV